MHMETSGRNYIIQGQQNAYSLENVLIDGKVLLHDGGI